MSRNAEGPGEFRRSTKVVVGLAVAACIISGVLYDPKLYTLVVAFCTLPFAVAYPLLYSTLPWKETLLGRALMTKARAVALLYLASMLSVIYPYPFKGYLMALITTYLGIGIGFQFIVLYRVKLEAQRIRTEQGLYPDTIREDA